MDMLKRDITLRFNGPFHHILTFVEGEALEALR